MKRPRFSPLLSLGLVAAALWVAPALNAQEPSLTPLKKSGIYELGEKAGWTVAYPAGTPAAGDYSFALRKNNWEVLKSGKLTAVTGTTTIEAVLNEPAMLYLELIPADATAKKRAFGAAVAPTELKPSLPRPADFDAFWAEKLKLLEAIPADPVLVPEESGKPDVEYATIKMKNITGSHVHGQIAKPKREGKFPAMLILQWAGGPYPLQKAWVTDRAAEGWLALNIEPHDVPGNMPAEFYAALPQLIKGYNSVYDNDRDRNYFLRMYLGAYRAAEYLASRPDWDGKILLATGTSMGGQQSIVVAGLNPKVTHLIVHVPAGADANGALHGRAAGYPNWDAKRQDVMQTARYFDTVNFASRIKATSLVSMGFIDEVCPPVGIWAMFNEIQGRKEAAPQVDAAHNHQATEEQQRPYTERAKAWMEALVKGNEPEVRS